MDAVSLDATHSFIAGKCGLVPVVTEYYGMALLTLFIYRGLSLMHIQQQMAFISAETICQLIDEYIGKLIAKN